MRRLVRAISVVAFVFAVGSCSSASPDSTGIAQAFRDEYAVELSRQTQDYAESVSSCMLAKGWENFRDDGLPVRTGGDPSWSQPDEELGYGIALGLSSTTQDASNRWSVLEYASALPELQRELFWSDYYGDADSAGCGEVQQPEDVASGSFSELIELNEIAEGRIRSDPKVVDAWAEWSRCLAEGIGIAASSQESLIDSLVNSLSEQMQLEFSEQGFSSEDQSELLAVLQASELEVAAVDVDCYVEHVAQVALSTADKIYAQLADG